MRWKHINSSLTVQFKLQLLSWKVGIFICLILNPSHAVGTVARYSAFERDGTRAETRFGLSVKWTSPFKSAGESVQSTAGSRGVRISWQTIDRPCSEARCKSSGYPLQSPISPSLPLPRVTVCHLVSNGLYSRACIYLQVRTVHRRQH